ncbi:ATP-binding cassette domain-containing protein, partial [Salmonella enterica]|uniref:ATP-binding cassette domain-containing protein n=1 Tax=Salmonella enterica TaxID=28901 RepID=UPI003CF0BB64
AYGDRVIVDNFSTRIQRGDRLGIIGPNGAGKTTLVNLLTGDFPPTSGTIRFFGEDVTHFPPYERIRRGLRRTYQISALFPGLTVQ